MYPQSLLITQKVNIMPKSLGDLIRIRRNKLDMTQTDLADLIGSSQQVIATIENGVVRRSKYMEPIFEELGITEEQAAEYSNVTSVDMDIVITALEEALNTMVNYEHMFDRSLVINKSNQKRMVNAILKQVHESVENKLKSTKQFTDIEFEEAEAV